MRRLRGAPGLEGWNARQRKQQIGPTWIGGALSLRSAVHLDELTVEEAAIGSAHQ